MRRRRGVERRCYEGLLVVECGMLGGFLEVGMGACLCVCCGSRRMRARTTMRWDDERCGSRA